MIYGFLAGILTDYTPYQVGLSAIPLAGIYIFIENKFFNKSEKYWLIDNCYNYLIIEEKIGNIIRKKGGRPDSNRRPPEP